MKKHNHSNTIPFEQLAERLKQVDFDPRNPLTKEQREVLDVFSRENALNYHKDLYPQVLAEVASWNLTPRHPLWPQLIEIFKNPRNLGVYYFCVANYRTLSPQHEHALYSVATPLILLAYKMYNNISYESWRDVDKLEFLVGHLMETMYLEIDLTKNRLVELREIGLTIKSGEKSGEKKDSRTTYGLTGLNSTELMGLNKLSQMMLCQTWCYHPAKRHMWMITNPKNWDEPQELLVQEEVFLAVESIEKTKVEKPKFEDLPWS